MPNTKNISLEKENSRKSHASRRIASAIGETQPENAVPTPSATGPSRDVRDAELAARAAWLHFVGGLTQSDVARRLGVPPTRAHRYIARAQADGLVRVFVDVSSAECVALETHLMRTYGLTECHVAMDVPEAGSLPLRALGTVGADYLMRVVAARQHKVIGIGNGRTLAAAVDAMGRVEGSGLRFVSMLGGLTLSYAANPYDVIHRLAEKTGAESYLMPAPLFANSAEDKQVMLAQTGIAATMDLIGEASLIIVGIGDLGASGEPRPNDRSRDIDNLRGEGALAEILGQFLDAKGRYMETPYDACVMAPALADLRDRDIVAIAGGTAKAEAVRAALRSGLLTGLIIDEATARILVEAPDRDDAVAAE